MIINCSERMVTLFLFSLVSFCEAAVAVLGDSQETGGGCNRYACEDTGACSSLKLPPS